MMQAAHLRTLSTTADRLGVTLPSPLADMIAAVKALPATPTTPEAETRTILAGLVENPKNLTKSIAAAAGRLAVAERHTALMNEVSRLADATMWQVARRDGEQVVEAFRPIIEPLLDVLNQHAGKVPEQLAEDDVPALDALTFASWRACSDALATLHAVWRGISALYGNPHPVSFTPDSIEMAAYVDVSAMQGYDQAARMFRAVEGMAVTNASATRSHRPVFVPSAVAAAGGTFRFAGPAETVQRMDIIITMATRQPLPAWQ